MSAQATTQPPAVNAASLPGQTRPMTNQPVVDQLPPGRAADAPPVAVKPPSLMGVLKQNEFVIHEYTVTIPVGHQPKDLLEPNYWMHHAKKLAINDKIDCLSMTGQWECTLRVVNKGDTWAKMRMLSAYDADGKDEAATPLREQYKIEFVPTQGYRVVHKDSRGIISTHGTKDEALKALDEHVEKLSKRQ